MLKKLLKHEFRATSRMMWPIFLGMLGLLILVRVTAPALHSDRSFWLLRLIAGLSVGVFGAGMAVLFFAPLVVSAVRFKRNVLGNEGYLTMTLPASVHQILTSKLIVSVTWYAATVLASCLLLFGSFASWKDFSSVFSNIGKLISDLFRMIGKAETSEIAGCVTLAAELFFGCVLAVTLLTLIVYASYAIGYSASRRKTLWTILLLYGFCHLVVYLAVAVLLVMMGGYWEELAESLRGVNLILGAALGCGLLLCAVFYFTARYFLTKKLNLE